jgi:hypothetical protein
MSVSSSGKDLNWGQKENTNQNSHKTDRKNILIVTLIFGFFREESIFPLASSHHVYFIGISVVKILAN